MERFLYSKKNAVNWYLLAFLSGTVNVGGLFACQIFVTHVTGFATMFGVDLAKGLWVNALGMLSIPLYFLGGAMLAGFLIERRIHAGQKPHYAIAMGTVCISLLTAAVGGSLGWFGDFGTALEVRHDYWLLVLLCGASGLQNAIVTSVSGAVVRTTHLTGITTDLGIGLIRVLFPTQNEETLKREGNANRLRMTLIIAFIVGSAVGGIVYLKFGYWGFLLPALIAAYATYLAHSTWERLQK